MGEGRGENQMWRGSGDHDSEKRPNFNFSNKKIMCPPKKKKKKIMGFLKHAKNYRTFERTNNV